MFLIHLLKIIFWVLVIRHTIRWVSYHLHHRNKKERAFQGNTRMPFDLEFALMYGINARLKACFKFKDLSYRKTLVQWKILLNEIYPPDSESNINYYIGTDLKSPAYTPIKSEGDLFAKKANPSCGGGVITGNNNLERVKKICNAFAAKPCAKNKIFVAPFLFNTKIVSLKNLKNSQKPMLFAKQIMACYCQNLWFAFFFIP